MSVDTVVPRSPLESVPVQTVAKATIEKAQRDGLFWRLRPGQVVAPNADGTPRVLYDGDTVPVPVVSMVGPLPVGARVQVVVSPPAGNHVVGFQGAPATGVRLLAYWARRTNKTGINAETGLIRFDGIPTETGHLYRLRLSGVSFTNTATRLFMRIRVSTTGAATTASPLLVLATHTLGTPGGGSAGGTREVVGYFSATADGTLSALTTLQTDLVVATVNAATESPNEFAVEDMGLLAAPIIATAVDL